MVSGSGTIDLHGAEFVPTWTRLAMTASINDTWIYVQVWVMGWDGCCVTLPHPRNMFVLSHSILQDLVNWQVGQSIMVTTTELKDARDFNRNEVCYIPIFYILLFHSIYIISIKNYTAQVRIIAAVKRTTLGTSVSAIQLTTALTYRHFGGREYQVWWMNAV